MIYQVLCTLLMIAGLFILLNIRSADVFSWLLKPVHQWRDKKRRIRCITGKPKGRITSTMDDAKDMLDASGMSGKVSVYKWAAVILAVAGLLIGLALDNVLAALVLAAGMACSPLIVIRIRTGDYIRNLNEKLESAMGTVTNNYIASGDLIGAIESSLHLIPSPVDNIFRQLYSETQLVDSDVVRAIRRMREHIDNRYWRDWCDVLIQCRRDRQMRFAMSGIVNRFGEMRRAQMEADTGIRKHMGDYIVTVLIVLGVIPLMAAMMPEWYTILTQTPAGKITLAVIMAAVLATAIWVARLYRPIEGGEKK